MLRMIGVLGVAAAALGLAACGGTNSPTGAVASSTDRGTLVDNPALRVASLNAADFTAQLESSASGPQLLELAGTPPNYMGYDVSTLGYHPYIDGVENATVMMDALTAARTALLSTFTPSTTDNGKLYVTGYSEGGYVAMATVKAMQAAGDSVTASAPSSGPYALEAFADAIFFGQVDIGATEFAPLISTSYQHVYGNVYTQTSDLYSPTYASDIGTLLPSTTPIDTLFQDGQLTADTAGILRTSQIQFFPNTIVASVGYSF